MSNILIFGVFQMNFTQKVINIFINGCDIYFNSSSIEERWHLKRVYLFSVIRCIRTNTVYKNSLVRHEKFMEFP